MHCSLNIVILKRQKKIKERNLRLNKINARPTFCNAFANISFYFFYSNLSKVQINSVEFIPFKYTYSF